VNDVGQQRYSSKYRWLCVAGEYLLTWRPNQQSHRQP
jgi:hypothetical protein